MFRTWTDYDGDEAYDDFQIAPTGQALTHAVGETWTGNSCPMQNWEVQYVKEFRYDAARQRYLNIEHDPAAYRDGVVNPSNPGELVLNPLSRTWTDYDGDEPYGDFEIAQTGQLTNLGSFELGTGFADPWSGGGGSGGANSKYYHADLISTTRLLSDASGSAATGSPTVFSAFGERIAGANPTAATRYGYAGKWGYQEHADFPFLHVGHRYYDPSTGRFIQRDPIGITGGLNVYEYCFSSPVESVDPDGTDVVTSLAKGFIKVTGGRKRTFLDRWGDRIAGRGNPQPGVPSAVGVGVSARRPKASRQPGQKATTNRLSSWLIRRGWGRAARLVRRYNPYQPVEKVLDMHGMIGVRGGEWVDDSRMRVEHGVG